MSSLVQVTTVHFPDCDGRPLGKSDEYRDAMVRHVESDEHSRLASDYLELGLCSEEGKLQFYRQDTVERSLSAREQSVHDAVARQQVAAARQRAEAEVARLRAELVRRPPIE